jgi:iron complex transport system permease protein
VVADLLARTIVAPRQLPVGALTALIGVPSSLLLMRRQPAAQVPATRLTLCRL